MNGMLINKVYILLVQKGNIQSCNEHLNWTLAVAENGYMRCDKKIW